MSDYTSQLIPSQLSLNEVTPEYITLNKRSRDITGQHFNKLTALGPVGKSNAGQIMWLCLCECGNTTVVKSQDIRNGHTRSCGCLQIETVKRVKRIHGMAGTSLYKIWNGIVKRCTNPNCIGYKYYGGRGISIADEWRHDFQAFHGYIICLSHYGEKGYSIDRINNDGNYVPGNLRFATRHEQSHNSRTSTLITYNDETKCISEWARTIGMNVHTLAYRLRILGMNIEDALYTPSRYRTKIIHPPT